MYAKALALLGLGLLGAAGALVDYWPVHSDIPVVSSALALPPRLVVPTESATFNPFKSVDVRSARIRPRAVPAVVTVAVPDVALLAALDASSAALDTQSERVEAAGILPPSLVVASIDTDRVPASPLDLTPPVISAPEATILAPVGQVEQGGDNMFTGAAKKSGRAVARTGSAIASGFVTGVSSVASAFGAFGRVFRF